MSIVQTTGITICKIATPTISTSPAYSAGDQIGGIIELTDVFRFFHRPFGTMTTQGTGNVQREAGKATLKSISCVDISLQSAAFDFWFFNQLPTVASSDNAALNISDAEILKLQHVYSFAPTYSTTSANSAGSSGGIDLVIDQYSGSTLNSIWVVAQIKTDAKTYTTTTALQFKFDFYID